MESVSGSQPTKQTNHGLVYVLIALGLIIVGLVIGIVFISLNNNQQPEPGETEEITCENMENVDNVAECAGDLLFNGDETTALDYYGEAIEKALSEGREQDASFLVASRSTQLVVDGKCEEALKMYDDLNYDDYSTEGKFYIYSYALSASIDCNDEQSEIKYNNLMSQDKTGTGDE
ncbi:hypothetical protein IJG89_03975 [Candidatus Saccharibacteria bacterium]|nr:hypothetical protein [Candidatus Saccharibacteria bacterium]